MNNKIVGFFLLTICFTLLHSNCWAILTKEVRFSMQSWVNKSHAYVLPITKVIGGGGQLIFQLNFHKNFFQNLDNAFQKNQYTSSYVDYLQVIYNNVFTLDPLTSSAGIGSFIAPYVTAALAITSGIQDLKQLKKNH